MNRLLQYRQSRDPETRYRRPLPEESVFSRLEALKTLASSLLVEVTSLERLRSTGDNSVLDLSEEVRNFEVELIRSALIRTGGVQTEAARLLNVKLTTLNNKIKRYRLDRKPGPSDAGKQ